jgi:uncharacterized protein (DUF342 family)
MATAPPPPPLSPPKEAPKAGPPAAGLPPEVQEQLNTLAARLRLSEERYVELRKKLVVIEQNMLANHKRVMSEVKGYQDDINDIKRVIHEIEDRVIALIKEIQLTAKREDIEVIRKYVELWNPLRFATVDQVEKICKELIARGSGQAPGPDDE